MSRNDYVPSLRGRKGCAQAVVQQAPRVALPLQFKGRMAHKRVMFKLQAREKILRGAEPLADAVRVTLGPKSKCVLIEKKWGRPLVCNDGVTIAKEVELKDPEENLGAADAPRGGRADRRRGRRRHQHRHHPGPRHLRRGRAQRRRRRQRHRPEARPRPRPARPPSPAIKALSRPVESRKEKAQVATISAHNDPAIGELVADALEKVGREGVDHRRGGQGHRDDAGGRRGDAVRPRLPVALLRHRRRRRWRRCSRTR